MLANQAPRGRPLALAALLARNRFQSCLSCAFSTSRTIWERAVSAPTLQHTTGKQAKWKWAGWLILSHPRGPKPGRRAGWRAPFWSMQAEPVWYTAAAALLGKQYQSLQCMHMAAWRAGGLTLTP